MVDVVVHGAIIVAGVWVLRGKLLQAATDQKHLTVYQHTGSMTSSQNQYWDTDPVMKLEPS